MKINDERNNDITVYLGSIIKFKEKGNSDIQYILITKDFGGYVTGINLKTYEVQTVKSRCRFDSCGELYLYYRDNCEDVELIHPSQVELNIK